MKELEKILDVEEFTKINCGVSASVFKDGDPFYSIMRVKEYAHYYSENINKELLVKIVELESKIRDRDFMIENGLGWEDLQNDIDIIPR